MKVVILAGGQAARIGEFGEPKPKPMIEIGGQPILWHIMRGFSHYGVNEFTLALGAKGDMIKRFMLDYATVSSDLTVKIRSGDVLRHRRNSDCDWTVDCVDTGVRTETGRRLKLVQGQIPNKTFMVTYGDAVADVNIKDLVAFHKAHKRLATVTVVRPPARFGHMVFDGDRVVEFSEKPQTEGGWINGGYFVFEPQVMDYIGEDQNVGLEHDPLERLAKEEQLVAYHHPGFWLAMDTLRDRRTLEELWEKGEAPWKVWADR